MKYGYVRVSSQTQNITRQMEEMYKQGLTDDVIFVDAAKLLNMTRGTFLKYSKMYK